MDKGIIAELIIQAGILVVAVAAAIISYKEYGSHKAKEYNQLLSKLNERYVGNKDVQYVVRFLREFESENAKPSAYQVELFLRFFEELGLYLKTKSLESQDVKEFFDYYFERFEKDERGQLLKEIIKHEDGELKYLNDYREIMNYEIPEHFF